MFYLLTVEDSFAVPPRSFSTLLDERVTTAALCKYGNRVVPDRGLCITVHAISKLGDAVIHATNSNSTLHNGAALVRATLDLVMWRPLIGQVLIGRVRACSPEAGLLVTLVFFEDIVIGPSQLPEGSEFDWQERVWKWRLAGNGDETCLFIDLNAEIKFRVVGHLFFEPKPHHPSRQDHSYTHQSHSNNHHHDLGCNSANDVPAFQVLGSITEQGLGPVCWWTSPQ
jgi:DNA-directed RNA polymerase III subunit RPC8